MVAAREAAGFFAEPVTPEELMLNLDPKPPQPKKTEPKEEKKPATGS